MKVHAVKENYRGLRHIAADFSPAWPLNLSRLPLQILLPE
jgi:hypothetical protein